MNYDGKFYLTLFRQSKAHIVRRYTNQKRGNIKNIVEVMRKSLLDYVKTNTLSFEECPLNSIDALILSWFSYYRFPDYLKEEKVLFKNFREKGLLSYKEMYSGAFNPRRSKKLFELASENPRFANVEFSDFRDETDTAEEKQFAALCMKFKENCYFVGFRGTDPSYVGWKEDFNLACRYPVPAQVSGLEYTREVMKKYGGEFYLGGHSKGGNIAVYAASNSGSRLQSRIIAAYNFDGPGFLNEVYSESGYLNFENKICKLIPQASFVGMLLETRHGYSVIRSSGIGFFQHDPFSWEVKGEDFVPAERTKGSIRLEKAVNIWVSEMPMDERERVIEMVYSALNTLDAEDFSKFFKTIYRQIPALFVIYKRLKEDDKKFFNEKLGRLKQLIFVQGDNSK